jgi:hypothetical protein
MEAHTLLHFELTTLTRPPGPPRSARAAGLRRRLELLDRRHLGEIGLDYVTPNQGERALQREVLSRIIELSDAHGGQVLTVHSRRAAEDVVDAFGPGFRGTWILHWLQSFGNKGGERPRHQFSIPAAAPR